MSGVRVQKGKGIEHKEKTISHRPTQTSADRQFINHEEHEGHEENIRSLRLPRKAGCPDEIIGTNGKAPEDERKPAYFRPAGLPIPPLSEPRIDSITIVCLIL